MTGVNPGEQTLKSEGDIWLRLARLWDAAAAERPNPEAHVLLLDALDNSRIAVVQTGAVEALSFQLARDNDLLPALLARLRHPRDGVRWRVAWVLGRMQSPIPAVVTALAGCLQDPSEAVRARAANALGRLGVDSLPVIAALLTVVGTPLSSGYGYGDPYTGEEGDLDHESRHERGSWWWWTSRMWAGDALGWLPAAATPEVVHVLLSAIHELHDGAGAPQPIVDAVRRLVAASPPLQTVVCSWAGDDTYPFHYQAGWFCRGWRRPPAVETAQVLHHSPSPHEIEELLMHLRAQMAALYDVKEQEAGYPAEGGMLPDDTAEHTILGTAHTLVSQIYSETSSWSHLLALLPDQPTSVRALVLMTWIHHVSAPSIPAGWFATRVTPSVQRTVRPLLLDLLTAPHALTRRLALAGITALDGAALHRWHEAQRVVWWQDGSNLALVARWMEAVSELTVALLEALRPTSTIQSQAASRVLVLNLPAMGEGTALLLDFLRRPHADLRRLREYAMTDLGVVRPGFAGIVAPSLIAGLTAIVGDVGQHHYQRQQAVILLKLLGADTPAVRGVLQACLHEEDQYLRWDALKALVAIVGPLPEVYVAMSVMLGAADAATRIAAIKIAECLGEVPLDLFVKIRALIGSADVEDELGMVAPAACRAFLALRVPDGGRPEQWQVLLVHPQPWTRLMAAKMLLALGVADESVLDTLLGCLKEGEDVAVAAIALLGTHGSRQPQVVTALLRLLSNTPRAIDEGITAALIPVLGSLGVENRSALEAVYAQLFADDFIVAGFSDDCAEVRALIDLARGDARAASMLRLRLTPRFVRLPRRVQEVLPALDDADAVALLLRAIQRDYNETDWNPRREIAALAQVAYASPIVSAALLDHLRGSTDQQFRAYVIGWLGRRGSMRPEILAALLSAMEEDDLEVCEAATVALSVLAPGDPAVVAAARTCLVRLHGSVDAASLVSAMATNPLGHGFEDATPPRLLVHDGEIDLLGERIRRLRWR